ncbi:MAG: UrcA family protein [Sphingomicrobium sp.]
MSFQLKASMTCAMSTIFFACATPALASTDPVVVTAPSGDERPTRVVTYRDLDLTLARDQKRLDRRVDAAIEDVCGLSQSYAVRTVSARMSYRACSNEAWTKARAEMGAAVALAQASSGAGGIEIADKAITVSARTSD